MPIFEYECLACGERFEKLVRSSTAATEVRCPQCGGAKVEKQVSGFAAPGGGGKGQGSGGASCGSGCSHSHCNTCH